MMAAMPYRYFYDCEFIEDGRLIDLVSIGVVDEYGREFYAVSTEFDGARAVPWVRRNVLDKLPSPADPAWRSRDRIRDDLYDFLVAPLRGRPAPAIDLSPSSPPSPPVPLRPPSSWPHSSPPPPHTPRSPTDLAQPWADRGRPVLPEISGRHDALVDARHNLARWEVLRVV